VTTFTRTPGRLCSRHRRFGSNLLDSAGVLNPNAVPHSAQWPRQMNSSVVLPSLLM
jgi:hypothetical protein